MPVVNVEIPKYSTAPKSFNASIITSAVPIAIAGRARGNDTNQNALRGLAPNALETSKVRLD